MRRPCLACTSIALPILLVACAEAPQPTGPALNDVGATPLFSVGQGQILMLDTCDPATFPPGACNPVHARSGMSFETFLQLLTQHQRVDSWRFSPEMIHVTRPVTFRVPNLGGVVHTITEVEEFGGGFRQNLNELSGNPDPAPECVHPDNPNQPNPAVKLIAPGDHDEVTIAPGEAKKYQCCLHPWMRAVSK